MAGTAWASQTSACVTLPTQLDKVPMALVTHSRPQLEEVITASHHLKEWTDPPMNQGLEQTEEGSLGSDWSNFRYQEIQSGLNNAMAMKTLSLRFLPPWGYNECECESNQLTNANSQMFCPLFCSETPKSRWESRWSWVRRASVSWVGSCTVGWYTDRRHFTWETKSGKLTGPQSPTRALRRYKGKAFLFNTSVDFGLFPFQLRELLAFSGSSAKPEAP